MMRKSRVLICLACFFIGSVGCGLSIYSSIAGHNSLLFSLGMILFFTFGVVAVHMALHFLTLPLPYNLFGKMSNSPFPTNPPLAKIVNSWGVIGVVHYTIPFINWYIFSNGLGIEIGGLGKVYLPYENITTMQRVFLGNYKVFHTCTEVRSPIVMPAKVFLAMQSSASEKDIRFNTKYEGIAQ